MKKNLVERLMVENVEELDLIVDELKKTLTIIERNIITETTEKTYRLIIKKHIYRTEEEIEEQIEILNERTESFIKVQVMKGEPIYKARKIDYTIAKERVSLLIAYRDVLESILESGERGNLFKRFLQLKEGMRG